MTPAGSGRRPGACPAPEELSAFYFGKLPLVAVEQVATHLDQCPQCQATLQALEGKDDPLVAELRQLRGEEPFTNEPECQVALDRAGAICLSGKPASGQPDSWSYPVPSKPVLPPAKETGGKADG